MVMSAALTGAVTAPVALMKAFTLLQTALQALA